MITLHRLCRVELLCPPDGVSIRVDMPADVSQWASRTASPQRASKNGLCCCDKILLNLFKIMSDSQHWNPAEPVGRTSRMGSSRIMQLHLYFLKCVFTDGGLSPWCVWVMRQQCCWDYGGWNMTRKTFLWHGTARFYFNFSTQILSWDTTQQYSA